jgi:phage shock protein PspC (stress-responsive transcriptional regulator)
MLCCQILPTIIYPTHRQLAIDETMVRFNGRLYMKQYNKAKPIKWGIKLYSLADSPSGYLLDFNVFTGKRAQAPPDGEGYQAVMELLGTKYLHCGHHVYMDNWYSSPKLFQRLIEVGTGACGTVRSNRKGLPKSFATVSNQTKKRADPVFYEKDKMIVGCWHDSGRLNFLSTIDGTELDRKEVRDKNEQSGYRTVSKPRAISKYNMHMGGVDLFDQLSHYYKYDRRVIRWYQVLYHFVVQAAMVNAYILYKQTFPNSTKSSAMFRREVGTGLCSSLVARSRSLQPPVDGALLRLNKQIHFPGQFDDRKYKPDCVVCSNGVAKGKRVQTTYCCTTCVSERGKNVPMCMGTCFRRYHTLLNFRY